MPVNPEYVGRSYPPAEPYQVARPALRAFATAVGAASPAHHDVAAAREAGYADLVAPPTFAVVVAQQAEAQLVADPGAGIDFTRVVHGEERFAHHRPIVAGDELAATLHVDAIRSLAGMDMVTTRVELADAAGEPVSTVTSMIVVRGED